MSNRNQQQSPERIMALVDPATWPVLTPIEQIPFDDVVAWSVYATCSQADPEAWFPDKGGSTRDAKKICFECPVRRQCLEYALANDERFGVWGGLSERERRKLRKKAAEQAEPAVEPVAVPVVTAA